MTPIRALLLMGGKLHNQPVYFAELAGIIAGEGHIDLRLTDDLTVLNPTALKQFQVVVNWTSFVDPEPQQVEALLGAVRAGMGYVALHGANATFWNSSEYLTMVGSRFLDHDPYKRFKVHIEDLAHPIVQGVSDFEIEDELFKIGGDVRAFAAFAEAYRQRRHREDGNRIFGQGPLQPEITVLASAEGHPLAYTRSFGEGRVHYNALGHDEKALRNSDYRRLVAQGVEWAAGGRP